MNDMLAFKVGAWIEIFKTLSGHHDVRAEDIVSRTSEAFEEAMKKAQETN